jgi:hypothetical protein
VLGMVADMGRGRRRGRVTRAGGRPRRSVDGGQAKDDRSNIWEPALLSGRASGRWQCGGLGRPLGAPPLRQWTEASAVRLAGLGNGGRRWAVAGGPVGGGDAPGAGRCRCGPVA